MPPSLASVQRIFTAACELRGEARTQLLQRECGNDAELHAAVLALLRSDESAAIFGDPQLDAMRATLRPDATPLPARIADFEVLDVLGRGGMGIVYRGRQQNPAREVAIKVLAPHAGGPQARARFQLEAEALGRLQHRGIAQILAAGNWSSPAGEQPFLAMELVRGQPLLAWAAAAQPDLPTRLGALIELCDAVHHAHQRGLIHRDLKPGNVFVDDDGHVKVLDFGIARLVDDDRSATLQTHTGEVLGTLAYMSPEQANGLHDRIDVRTDVYAAGVLGYQLLAGVLPIAVDAPSLTANLRRIAEADPLPLGRHDRSFAGDLETIFAKALRKEPEHRYASMQAFGDDLRRFLAHEPIAARPTTFGYLASRYARRHRGLVAGLALALVAMVGGTTASVLWALRADANAVRATQAEGAAKANEQRALTAEQAANTAATEARRAESAAKDEAQVADSVTRFVEELFSQAAPEIAQGHELSVKDLVRRGAAMVRDGLGDQPLRRARLARLLGTVLTTIGDAKTALPLAEDAVKTLAAQLAPDDPRLLEAKHTLASNHFARGDGKSAEALFAEVLAAAERAGSRDPDLIARCHEGLGACASTRGDLDGALQHYTAMQAARRDHPDPDVRGLDLMRLGVVYNQRRDSERADELFSQAYELLRKGNNPTHTAQLASNLGILRLRQGRLDEAEELFQDALALGDRALGPEHPIQMRRLCNLAGLYSQQERLAEAEPLLVRALAIGDKAGSDQDDVTANVLMNLGNVRLQQGQHEAAVPLYERAAGIYERRFGKKSRDLADALENLARSKEELGRTDEARALRARVAAIRGH